MSEDNVWCEYQVENSPKLGKGVSLCKILFTGDVEMDWAYRVRKTGEQEGMQILGRRRDGQGVAPVTVVEKKVAYIKGFMKTGEPDLSSG